MKVVATYHRVDEAHLARACLEDAGITAHLRDEHTVTTDWGLTNAVGGVRLEVVDDDLDAACQVLADFQAAAPGPTPPEPGARPPHLIGRYVKLFFILLIPIYGVMLLLIDAPGSQAYIISGIITIPAAVLIAGICAVRDL